MKKLSTPKTIPSANRTGDDNFCQLLFEVIKEQAKEIKELKEKLRKFNGR
jgi:hypothetical protein